MAPLFCSDVSLGEAQVAILTVHQTVCNQGQKYAILLLRWLVLFTVSHQVFTADFPQASSIMEFPRFRSIFLGQAALGGIRVSQVACGQNHSLVLSGIFG